MKRSSLFTNVLFVLLLVAAGLAGTANAITYTWDVLPGTVDPGNGQIDDGAGTWDAADANNWTIDVGANNIKWADGSDAVFGTGLAGTAGVVTIAGTVSTPSVTFNKAFDDTSYSLTGGTLTLTGAATVTTDGATNDIASNITGADGLTKAGAGTLTLSGAANDYTGTTTINLGTLALSGTGTLGVSGNNLTLAGGSLAMGGASQTVGAVDIQAAGVIGNGGTLNAASMTKSNAGTGQLSALTTVMGLTTATATTVGGGTLQYSANGSTDSLVIDGGNVLIDNGVSLTSNPARSTVGPPPVLVYDGNLAVNFLTSNSIDKAPGGTGALKFRTDSSYIAVNVPTGITGTINANLDAGGAFNNQNGNHLTLDGGGKLVLAGNAVLVFNDGTAKSADFRINGGSELEVTGTISTMILNNNTNSLGNRGSSGAAYLGGISGNNTLRVTGTGKMVTGNFNIGSPGANGNKVYISAPGVYDLLAAQYNQTLPPALATWILQGNSAQLNMNSSNNLVEISNGAFVQQASGGGSPGWKIGDAAGTSGNQIVAKDYGTTVSRNNSGNLMVGNIGSSNSLIIESGALWIGGRPMVGVGNGTDATNSNYILVTGKDPTTGTPSYYRYNGGNGDFVVGSTNNASSNNFRVEAGARADIFCGRTVGIGRVAGADNNYVSVTGAGSVLNLLSTSAFAVGGAVLVAGGSGNHMDVSDGGSLILTNLDNTIPLAAAPYGGWTTWANPPQISTPLVLAGDSSALNVGNGPSYNTALAKVGTVSLQNATSSLNINNGRLTAGANGAMISGLGQVNLLGPAYIDTAGFDTSIESPITGAGGLTKEGEGSLTISGAHDYAGETIVKSGGTLNLEQVGLDDLAAVKIEKVGAVCGKIYISFFDISDVSDVVSALWLGGEEMIPGKYNVTNKPDYFLGSATGWLEVITSNVPGDTNNDGVVDAADYITVKQNFGMTGATLGAEQGNFTIDTDTNVDWDDLQILMARFSTRSIGGVPAVPEPGSVMLLMFGAAALLRRRTRR